ncbi:hypothetical protein PR202_ga18831 [Eleusine coracana subsp. coracana]|uniref:Bifunctional inhibitor/plant lipid transfer protein/seed storage helical domain-containing protein n=1 Tax=Eleusine coracana subsp. coracana TaxID=191504 RepID=A0AAV5CTR7_ELECO|nr:hypothetical protein PR202_ga18831 [Eleusine coracana subsp. coracana]
MESTNKLSALLVLAMLALSSPLALAREMAFQPECNSCQTGGGSPSTGGGGSPSAGGVTLPPVTLPPILSKPPISLPPVTGLVPPVLGGGLPLPPVTGVVPPVVGGVAPVVGGVAPVVGGVAPVVGGVAPVIGGGVTPVVGGIVTPIIGGGGGGSSSPPKKSHHGGRKACPPPPSPPTPTPTPTPSSNTCPIDALKLGACVDLLGNDVHIGDANVQCCPLVKGVAGLSAAACLCTAIKAKVLDLSVYVPIALKLLLNCGCAVPPGYDCA